jgi:hypothetical protein
MFRNGCLESIEALMAEGEIYDIEYSPWIPVSERLPEEGQKVLVDSECFGIVVAKYGVCCDIDGTNKSDFLINRSISSSDMVGGIMVKTWMPLPEPQRK